jgi:DNA-binding transcriptional MerR regulator
VQPSTPGGNLRPVDLARAAGVSTQQIRNYAAAGVLPPVGRSATGYRRFGPRHQDAVLTYRALAAAHGWDPAGAILRAVHAGDVAAALALLDAGHAALHEERRALEATSEALEAVVASAGPDPGVPRGGLRIGEAAALLGVRTSALRVWEAAGLLRPGREPGTGYRRYGRDDVRDARVVGLLRRGNYPLERIRPVLDGLGRSGGTEELRAALAERRTALTVRSAAMLAAAARLHDYVTTYS